MAGYKLHEEAREKMRTTEARVAILGGGLAGLYSAHLLHSAGIHFQLFEARDRLGGRIFSADESGRASDDGFDLGPSWFWPGVQPGMTALVKEMGLAAFAQNIEGDVIFERMSRETPQRYRGMSQEAQSMRLVGGTAALVKALAGGLPDDRLHLGSRVTLVQLGDSDVTLTISRADGSELSVTASQVIAALPPRLLEATISFTPAVDSATARHWRETPTWMAPHAKFFALYDRPFWREAGLSGTAQSMVGPLAEIHDATTASGNAALFGFLGIGAHQRRSIGEAALAQACVRQLARLFGPEALNIRATIFKDWAADALTATAEDRNAGGHPMPYEGPWVTGAWQHCLSLAGSETGASDPGYLAGAISAARRAVTETIERLSASAGLGTRQATGNP